MAAKWLRDSAIKTLIKVCAGVLLAMPLMYTPITAAQEAAQEQAPDVRLIIDISGSMKLNDPANLRRPAVDLLVKLLPEDAKAGVWTFGRQVNMLIPHKPVGEDWRQSAATQANKINSVGLYTNIGSALEKAAYDAGRSSSDYKTSLILLTDGMVDISKDPAKNQQEWRRIVEDVLPKLKQSGYTIHTIALSDNADQALMSQLAMATDGLDAVAKNADELMQIFLQAFNKSAPAEQLPFDGESFLVDSSVEEFTALIFYQDGSDPTELLAPDNSRYSEQSTDDSVRWFAGDGYDLVTVKRPYEGEWRVKANVAPNSRITVVSDLSLKVAPMANNLKPGETIDLSVLFKEDGKKITSSDFLNLLEVDAQISGAARWNKSLSGAGVPANGVYTTKIDQFNANGEYRLVVNVDGKTFKRRFEHSINVRAPFVAKLQELDQASVPTYQLLVTAPGQDINFDVTQMSVDIVKPDGEQEKFLLPLQPNRSWALEYKPDMAGEYRFNVKAMGQLMNGAAVNESLPVLSLNYQSELAAVVDKPAVDKVDDRISDQAAANDEPAADQSPVAEDSNKELIKYGAIAAINLLLLIVGFFVIRKIIGKKKPEEDGDEEEEGFVNVNEEAEAAGEEDVEQQEEVTADESQEGEDTEEVAAEDSQTDAEVSEDADIEENTEVEAEIAEQTDSEDTVPVADDDSEPATDKPEGEAEADSQGDEPQDVDAQQDQAAEPDELAMDEMAEDEPEAVELTEEVQLQEDDMGMAEIDDGGEEAAEAEQVEAEPPANDAKQDISEDLDDIDALLDAVAESNSSEEDFDIDDLLASEGGLDISSDEAIDKDIDEVKKPA